MCVCIITMSITRKPWGHELLWALTANYAAKILYINQGHRLSLQLHEQKEETIYVLRGTMYLHIGNDGNVIVLLPGQTYHIAPRTIHRMEARDTDVEVVEVSTPQLYDVVRIEDDYGR